MLLCHVTEGSHCPDFIRNHNNATGLIPRSGNVITVCPNPQPIQMSALGADWDETAANQSTTLVTEALLATRRLKQKLMQVWGPRAVSLGTVAVEAVWWQFHLMNTNRAAVWSTPEWREYHQVQTWKKCVLTILRQMLPSVLKNECSGFAQAASDLEHLLREGARQPLWSPSSKPAALATTDRNNGFDKFVAEQCLSGV
jgi:hypothetical protein